MKLIDLLVQELPKRGGWPDGAIYVCTEKDGTPRIVGPCWHDNKSLSSFKINDDKSIIYSDQYESALAASQKPAWNGEGLPPVGCECEISFSGKSLGQCEVLFVGDSLIVWKQKSSQQEGSGYYRHMNIRPLHTEAEMKREAALDAIYGAIASAEREHNRSDEADKVYEAIAAGKIPGVKLDD